MFAFSLQGRWRAGKKSIWSVVYRNRPRKTTKQRSTVISITFSPSRFRPTENFWWKIATRRKMFDTNFSSSGFRRQSSTDSSLERRNLSTFENSSRSSRSDNGSLNCRWTTKKSFVFRRFFLGSRFSSKFSSIVQLFVGSFGENLEHRRNGLRRNSVRNFVRFDGKTREKTFFFSFSFGHQESIQSIDALMRERCVTAGGRDNSFRLWKIVEESHLVFNGPKFDTKNKKKSFSSSEFSFQSFGRLYHTDQRRTRRFGIGRRV